MDNKEIISVLQTEIDTAKIRLGDIEAKAVGAPIVIKGRLEGKIEAYEYALQLLQRESDNDK